MNTVTVGSGSSERSYVIAPGETQTVDVDTAIRNEKLDEWWVSHLERNQVTDLHIDVYLVVEAAGEQFRIDLDSIEYSQTIETDIFGNKAQYPTGEETETSGGGDRTESSTPSEGGEPTETATTESSTETSGPVVTDEETATAADETPTTGDGTTETPTDDGGILTDAL